MSKNSNLYPTKYKIKYWDELNNVIVIEHGLIYAESYADFMVRIEDFYGSDNIVSIEVAQLEYGPILLSKEQYEHLDDSFHMIKEGKCYVYADEDDF